MVNVYAPGHHNRNPYGGSFNPPVRIGGGGGGYGYAGGGNGAGYGGAGGMGGGGSYGLPSGYNANRGYTGNLSDQYQQALNRANAANEARYQDILGQYGSLYDRAMKNYDVGNKQRVADINTNFDNQLASSQADLVSRGLRNSTIAASNSLGNQRDRQRELNRENESYMMGKINLDTGLTNDRLNFMERKTEAGPDFNQLAQLMQSLGEGGGGGGGGYGGLQAGYGALANLGRGGVMFSGAGRGQKLASTYGGMYF